MWQLDGPVELLECDEVVQVVRQGRSTPGDVTFQDGLPVAAHAADVVEVVATLQPMGGKDLLLVPEGFRDKETLWLWQAHRTLAQGDFRIDVTDLVLYSGKAYQVQSSEDWSSYTRSMLIACDAGLYKGPIDPSALPPVYPLAD